MEFNGVFLIQSRSCYFNRLWDISGGLVKKKNIRRIIKKESALIVSAPFLLARLIRSYGSAVSPYFSPPFFNGIFRIRFFSAHLFIEAIYSFTS